MLHLNAMIIHAERTLKIALLNRTAQVRPLFYAGMEDALRIEKIVSHLRNVVEILLLNVLILYAKVALKNVKK